MLKVGVPKGKAKAGNTSGGNTGGNTGDNPSGIPDLNPTGQGGQATGQTGATTQLPEAKNYYYKKVRELVNESIKKYLNEGELSEVGDTYKGQYKLGRLSGKRDAQASKISKQISKSTDDKEIEDLRIREAILSTGQLLHMLRLVTKEMRKVTVGSHIRCK